MQLVIRDDIDLYDGNETNRDLLEGNQVEEIISPSPSPSASSERAPRTSRPVNWPPLYSHRHLLRKPDFSQPIFKGAKNSNDTSHDEKRKEKFFRNESQFYNHDNKLLWDAENDLKPWQRYFRSVFHRQGIKYIPSLDSKKISYVRQSHLFGQPPSRELSQRRENNSLQDSSSLRSVPFQSFNPGNTSDITSQGQPRPLLHLGLVPPSYPAAARDLGVGLAEVNKDQIYQDVLTDRGQYQTPLISSDAFLRKLPDTVNTAIVPVEESRQESGVAMHFTNSEQIKKLDDLISARAERKIRHNVLTDSHHHERETMVTLRPRGGNKPFFFTSDVAPMITKEQRTGTARPPQEQKHHPKLERFQIFHYHDNSQQSAVVEPHLEFGFQPLGDNPFFFTTEKPKGTQSAPEGSKHRRQRYRHIVNNRIGFRDISAVAADAVRKVKATQYDMRNLFFIPPERAKFTRNVRSRKKLRKNTRYGLTLPLQQGFSLSLPNFQRL